MFITKAPRINALASRRFRNINDLIDDLFDDVKLPNAGELQYPYVNIREDKDAFEIAFIAPGFLKEQFSLCVEEGTLQVKGDYQSSASPEEPNYTRKEYVFRSFERSFGLPENVHVDGISASYVHGILRVNLPKVAKVKSDAPKKITIA